MIWGSEILLLYLVLVSDLEEYQTAILPRATYAVFSTVSSTNKTSPRISKALGITFSTSGFQHLAMEYMDNGVAFEYYDERAAILMVPKLLGVPYNVLSNFSPEILVAFIVSAGALFFSGLWKIGIKVFKF